MVLATMRELAEHGLASVAFALPMPVGPAPQVSELDRLRAQVAELLAERHVTNEALDDAVQELRARQAADGITRRIAPTQPLRADTEGVRPHVAELRNLLAGQRAAVEDPHDGPLAHRYRVPRDLPPLDGAR
jgi:hypothetical protein